MKDINKIMDNFSLKILHDEEPEQEINEIFQYYSIKIGKSIQPLNPVSAPFVYRLLTEYAKAVQKCFPKEAGMADCLGETQMTTIIL